MGLRQEGYWDSHYELELRNYEEDGDEGEVWFGKILNNRIVEWIHRHILPKRQDHTKVQLIDIGCGNAYTIRSIYEKLIVNERETLVTDSLTIYGLDYAAKSIELSREIMANCFTTRFSDNIKLKQCDFLCAKQLFDAVGNTKFDYIIDKGTFDAICLLSSESTELLETNKLKYVESLYSLIEDEAIFIIASCNHTEEELLSLFKIECSSRKGAELIDKIDTPKLKYGGQEGSQVTCLIIKLGEVGFSLDFSSLRAELEKLSDGFWYNPELEKVLVMCIYINWSLHLVARNSLIVLIPSYSDGRQSLGVSLIENIASAAIADTRDNTLSKRVNLL